MTRPEITGTRGLGFSAWVREKLPDSQSGFCVTNQDWIFWNYKTRRLLLAEEKTRKGRVSPWFATLIKTVLHPALSEYCPKAGIDYRGYHLIVFENTTPADGKIWFDNKEVTEAQLKHILELS